MSYCLKWHRELNIKGFCGTNYSAMATTTRYILQSLWSTIHPSLRILPSVGRLQYLKHLAVGENWLCKIRDTNPCNLWLGQQYHTCITSQVHIVHAPKEGCDRLSLYPLIKGWTLWMKYLPYTYIQWLRAPEVSYLWCTYNMHQRCHIYGVPTVAPEVSYLWYLQHAPEVSYLWYLQHAPEVPYLWYLQ